MSEPIRFGIGFLAGRPNVCKIINRYYQDIIEQGEKYGKEIKFTIFILYDLNYQGTKRIDFYNIKSEVYKKIEIKYIAPEDIEEEKKILVSRYDFNKKDIDLILGHGYAKARNSIMYFALKRKIDYLFFWDDDEYLVANISDENNQIEWVKQDDILQHLKNIKNADVTVGYRCGNISPVPKIEYNNIITEQDFKHYIDGISNEAVTWDKLKNEERQEGGISFANRKIVFEGKAHELKDVGINNWLWASGICFNLKRLENIPAFYNPPFARGEDTFLSTLLKNAKVVQVPTYHFHDGFLKYSSILENKFPKKFNKIKLDESVEERFLRTSIGWIKYKPLLIYITDRKNYSKIIKQTREDLEKGITAVNKLFDTESFNVLLDELNNYAHNVRKHYNEYIKTNEVWNKLKSQMKF